MPQLSAPITSLSIESPTWTIRAGCAPALCAATKKGATAGFAAPDLTRPHDLVALRALGRGYRLTHLVHLPMYGSFYLTDNTATATNWAAAEMFVAWLLAADNKQKLRRPFLDYVIAALRDRKGDSSTAFDRIIGTPIERLEEPWLEWLHKIAGN